jgi:hypothetical protein
MAIFKAVLLLTMFVFAMSVCAAEPAMTLEDRKAEIDAQIELLRKEAELSAAMRQANGGGALTLPMVVSIGVVGEERSARLHAGSGVVSRYREGETIRPGVVINAITPTQVTVSIREGKKSHVVPLEFLAAASAASAGAMAGGQPAYGQPMPGMPRPPDFPLPMVPALPTMPPVPTVSNLLPGMPALKSLPGAMLDSILKK